MKLIKKFLRASTRQKLTIVFIVFLKFLDRAYLNFARLVPDENSYV